MYATKKPGNNMVGFRKRASLSSDFLIFSVAIFLVTILLSTGFWFQVYREELAKKRVQLSIEASRINTIVSDSVSYISQYASFIGEKVIQYHNPNDLGYIARLIGGKYIVQPQQHNFYFTTTFDWVTPDKMLRASSNLGVLSTPYDMSDRDYLQQTPEHPWELQLGKPRIGGISGKWIVPAGMGIADEEGRFLGTITLGFSLGGLEKKITEAHIEPDVHYLLLTDDLQPALNSKRDNTLGPDSEFSLNHMVKQQLKHHGYLKKPIVYNGTEYAYVEKVAHYPYLILTGYNDNMPGKLFASIVLSRGLALLGLGLIAITALILLRRRLVEPIMELSKKADLIRKGEKIQPLSSPVHEIMLLDAELLRIAEYIRAEQQMVEELNLKTSQLEHKAVELEQANLVAFEARDAAIKASRAKSDFLANMSHELRTPMNAVIGITNILMMKTHAPEKQKEFLKTMHISANHLLQLINDLLDIAKLESQEVKLEEISFSLEAAIKEVAAINEIKAHEKGITLEVIGQPDPCQLIGDPHRLKQVLINLVGNAIKFTEKGGVTITWQCHKTSPEGKYDVAIKVKDTGIGIPQEQLSNIFAKFVQADTSTTRKYGGTGLGLSISNSLVELMHGNLQVESVPGRGSCFTILLSLPKAGECA